MMRMVPGLMAKLSKENVHLRRRILHYITRELVVNREDFRARYYPLVHEAITNVLLDEQGS